MPEVSEPYIREQLERRRGELQATISAVPSAEETAPFVELLQEVDSAIQHIHDGTYGTCVVCQGTVEGGTADCESAREACAWIAFRRRSDEHSRAISSSRR